MFWLHLHFPSQLLCILFPVPDLFIYPEILGVLAAVLCFTPLCKSENSVLSLFLSVFQSSRGIIFPWAISVTDSIGKEHVSCRTGSIICWTQWKWNAASCSRISRQQQQDTKPNIGPCESESVSCCYVPNSLTSWTVAPQTPLSMEFSRQ